MRAPQGDAGVRIAPLRLAACLLLLLAMPAWVGAQRTRPAARRTAPAPAHVIEIPDDTPTGDAAADPRTSEAVTRIIGAMANAFGTTDNFYAKGRFIESTKVGTSERTSSANFEILFRRPDLLKVVLKGDADHTVFVADGTTVTMTWPDEERYLRLPQPAQLAAFAEEERAGELAEDETRNIMRTTAPAMLISDDALAWIRSNVVKYVFEGSEKVGEADTWRIKFIQENPDMVVNTWMDKRTGFVRRVSVVMGRSEDDAVVESYAEASVARMQIALFDTISTSTQRVPRTEFRAPRIPRSWKPAVDETVETERAGDESVWLKLFRAAAAQTGDETSATIAGDDGTTVLRTAWFRTTPARIGAMATLRVPEPAFHLLLANRRVQVVDARGEATRAYRIGAANVDRAAILTGTTTPLLLTAVTAGGPLQAWHTDTGRPAWERGLGMALGAVLPLDGGADTPPSVLAAGTDGVYAVAADGRLLFSSRRMTGVFQLRPITGDDGTSRVAALDTSGRIGLLSRGARLQRRFEVTDSPVRIFVDDAAARAPYLVITPGESGDMALQRLDTAGAPVWTVGAASPARNLSAVGIRTLRLRLNDDGTVPDSSAPPRTFLCTVMNDGRVSLFTGDGLPVWRGRVTSSDPTFMASENDGILDMEAADLDGDGDDELLLALPNGLLAVEGP